MVHGLKFNNGTCLRKELSLKKTYKNKSNRRPLGQHFLEDESVLRRIADAVKPAGNLVLEVGPGTGNLTDALLGQSFEVYALEFDPQLARRLKKRFKSNKNAIEKLHIIEGDARTYDLSSVLEDRSYSVVANLPYYAANPIVRRFLEIKPRPIDMVIMLQREVARELVADQGKLSILGISVQIYAEVSFLFDVLPEAFVPPPAVFSSVVHLRLRPNSLVIEPHLTQFFQLIKGVFKNPRKQLHNALIAAPWAGENFGSFEAKSILENAGIHYERRPETLTISEWIVILEAFIDSGNLVEILTDDKNKISK